MLCRPKIIYMMYPGLGNVPFFYGRDSNCLVFNSMRTNAGLGDFAQF